MPGSSGSNFDVAGPLLCGLGVEQRAVEGGGAVHVGDGDREVWLHLSHVESSFVASGIT